MSTKTDYVALTGGMTLEADPVSTPPGMGSLIVNYECSPLGGYESVEGYERYDGRPSPADATYYVVNFDAGSATVSIGDTVTGATSSATGICLAYVVQSGSEGGANAAGYLVLANVSGTFQNNENLQVSAATKCVANGAAIARGASSATLDRQYWAAAVDYRRSLIGAPTGTGAILGVAYDYVYDKGYAFRVDSTNKLNRSSTSGWSAVDYCELLHFTSGSGPFTAGTTVTGGTSGATAKIQKVVVTSGIMTGTGAGWLNITGRAGTFSAAETITATGSTATSRASSPVESGSVGSYRCQMFAASIDIDNREQHIYGASCTSSHSYAGVVFQIPAYGSVVNASVRTLLTGEYGITCVGHFANHLFIGKLNGSVVHSAPGDTGDWTSGSGAATIEVGEPVMGFANLGANAMAILCDASVYILSGTSSADWVLTRHSNGNGAIQWAVGALTTPLYASFAGVQSLYSTANYTNFDTETLTLRVSKWYEANASKITAAYADPQKSQLVILTSDKKGIILKIANQALIGATLIDIPHQVKCAWDASSVISTTNATKSKILVGLESGYVAEINRGTSFDGAPIESKARLMFNHGGTPFVEKAYESLDFNIEAKDAVIIEAQPLFSNGSVLRSIEDWRRLYVNATTTGLDDPNAAGEYDDDYRSQLTFASLATTSDFSSTYGINALLHHAGFWWAVGNNGTIWRSHNRTTWVAVTSGTTDDLFAIAAHDKTMVSVGEAGRLCYSTDYGASWTATTVTGVSGTLYNVASNQSGMWVVGADATKGMSRTTDFVSWANSVTVASQGNADDLKFGRGVFVASKAGTIYRSVDNGATWSSVHASGTQTGFRLATDGKGAWIGAGDTAECRYSTNDGSTWSSTSTVVFSGTPVAAEYDPAGRWLVLMDDNTLWQSTNLVTWYQWDSTAINAGTYDCVALATDRRGAFLISATQTAAPTVSVLYGASRRHGQDAAEATVKASGHGTNIGINLVARSATARPHRLNGAFINYSYRGAKK